MPPSPTHKTDYVTDALSLLTSRYQTPRPGSLVSGAAALALAPWNVAAAGTSAPWSPLSLPGLKAWYRADLGISPPGGPVATWADQSGTGDANKNAAQATGSKQPTLNASDAVYNHQATLSFASASSQGLATGTWAASLAEPETIFVVGNFDGAAVNEYMADDLTSNQRVLFNANGASLFAAYAGASLSSGLALSSAPSVFGVIFNGASSSVFVSANTAKATGTTGTPGARTGLTIGSSGGGAGQFLNGKVAEIVICAGGLGSTDIAKFNAYANTRYGIAIGP